MTGARAGPDNADPGSGEVGVGRVGEAEAAMFASVDGSPIDAAASCGSAAHPGRSAGRRRCSGTHRSLGSSLIDRPRPSAFRCSAAAYASRVGPSWTRYSAGCWRARDEVSRADVGGEHRLLDQLVRLGARARSILSMRPFSSQIDLGLGGLRSRSRRGTRALLSRGAIGVVQVQQVRHQFTAPPPRGRACWRGSPQPRCGEARVRADHRRIELVGIDLARR